MLPSDERPREAQNTIRPICFLFILFAVYASQINVCFYFVSPSNNSSSSICASVCASSYNTTCFVLSRIIFIFCMYVYIYIRIVACENNVNVTLTLTTVQYVASFYLRKYMLQDVVECRIPKRGHCDLNLSCYGQIQVFFSGMGPILFGLSISAFIFCMCKYQNTAECFI